MALRKGAWAGEGSLGLGEPGDREPAKKRAADAFLVLSPPAPAALMLGWVKENIGNRRRGPEKKAADFRLTRFYRPGRVRP